MSLLATALDSRRSSAQLPVASPREASGSGRVPRSPIRSPGNWQKIRLRGHS
ncbi:hypothetical protein [Bradyrhizobium australafricanum]|uniref:hypothetical protein n=1 Tax=Bradyrhizobium australafricanum TaxID=2821406 RepID=UPI001CE23BE9|nr:hypothetical protein [Bradyrhizobium australafricanum]MCA6105069.1 hypothetical protein [Bradyrhizobium australafricanum]